VKTNGITLCKVCDGEYSRNGGGTTSLENHLKSKHKLGYQNLVENEAKKRTDAEQCERQITPFE
jgi:hypothetical protein